MKSVITSISLIIFIVQGKYKTSFKKEEKSDYTFHKSCLQRIINRMHLNKNKNEKNIQLLT